MATVPSRVLSTVGILRVRTKVFYHTQLGTVVEKYPNPTVQYQTGYCSIPGWVWDSRTQKYGFVPIWVWWHWTACTYNVGNVQLMK